MSPPQAAKAEADAIGEGAELQCMSRDEFAAFYQQTAPALRRYLARIAPTEADDLLQEAYIRLLDAAPVGEAQRRGYLYRAATNLAMDRFRAERRNRSGLLSWLRGQPTMAEVKESGTLVEQAFRSLGVRERALLWLAYVEGATHVEIGVALGLGAASVRVLLFRAKRKMAALLKGER